MANIKFGFPCFHFRSKNKAAEINIPARTLEDAETLSSQMLQYGGIKEFRIDFDFLGRSMDKNEYHDITEKLI